MTLTNKKKYAELVTFKEAGDLRVFSTPDWLDLVCGPSNWDACIAIDKGGRVMGMMPFCFKRSLGQLVIRMPKLTPFLDIWINYPAGMRTASRKDAYRRRVIRKLINQLPKFVYFSQHYSYSLTDWLPFYWQGFQQTTLYSFIMEPGKPTYSTFEGLKSETRNMVRRAAQHLDILESDDTSVFHALNSKSFQRQGISIPYSHTLLDQLNRLLRSKDQSKLYLAQDIAGGISAGILIVYGHKTNYCLASGLDKKKAIPGAMQFLLWHAIEDAMRQGRSFDFEGSMIPGVAKMFSGFGAEQTPYYKIYKGQNKLIEVLNTLRR